MKFKFYTVRLLVILFITGLLIFFSCNNKETVVIPKLVTIPLSDINCHSARSGGVISSESDLNILQKGVCFSKVPSPDTSDSRTNDGDGSDSFLSYITGLEIYTKYYARAYLISSFGIQYGNELSFTTSSCDSLVYGGKIYHAVQIGNQCWTTENLNLGITLHGNQNQLNNGILEQYAYNNKDSNLIKYGGLFQWNEQMDYSPQSSTNPSGVQGIAPEGWHIPSDAEWQELELFIGMSHSEVNSTGWRGSVGAKLKQGGITGFNAQFAGRVINGIFSDINYYGYYWTCTTNNYNDAMCRIIDHNSALIKRDVEKTYHGMSVRFVKD